MKVLSLAAALLLGILFPYGHPLTFLVRYSVMILLLFAFLQMEVDMRVVSWKHVGISIFAHLIAFLGYFSLIHIQEELALVAYITSITPTAAAGPVIMGFLKGEVAFVTFSVLITSAVVAITIPLSLPYIIKSELAINILDILIPVFVVVFIPLLLALFIRNIFPRFRDQLLHYHAFTYYLFVANVYIAMSKASYFIQFESNMTWWLTLAIGGVSFVVGFLNVIMGYYLGGHDLKEESSMALARKNTMFAVWLALTFLSPAVAIGPMFYIIWQNAYHSFLLYKMKT